MKQATILAAGRGKRMAEGAAGASIQNVPKALMDVRGEPLIEAKIRSLVRNGIDVCVVINPEYEEMFRSKLSNYDLTYCYQSVPKGTASALYAAKRFVKEDLFLVMMGDDVVQYDIKKMSTILEPVVFGYKVPELKGYGALIVDQNGYVTDIAEKQLTGPGLVNTGVYVMPLAFFAHYHEIERVPGGEALITDVPKMLSHYGIKFRMQELDEWVGINTYADLIKVNGSK